MDSTMTNVKILTQDWARELRSHLRDLFTPEDLDGTTENPHAILLDQYITWAEKYYDEKEVPPASEMASCYYQCSEAVSRKEEDKLLIEEMKSRTEPMSNQEWQDYCKTKEAIIITNEYALLTDGYYDSVIDNR
jgi:uncharacterized protein (DUF885 family)